MFGLYHVIQGNLCNHEFNHTIFSRTQTENFIQNANLTAGKTKFYVSVHQSVQFDNINKTYKKCRDMLQLPGCVTNSSYKPLQ